MRSALEQVRSNLARVQVFSEPYTTPEGATVIGVSSAKGNGTVSAVGIFVVSGGECVWTPAVDDTRIALLGITVGLVAATISTLAVLRRPPWPNLIRTVR